MIPRETNIEGMPEGQRAGFAVLCNAQTLIRHVLRDDLRLYTRIELRPSFVDPGHRVGAAGG
jgi:hypothetical protein